MPNTVQEVGPVQALLQDSLKEAIEVQVNELLKARVAPESEIRHVIPNWLQAQWFLNQFRIEAERFLPLLEQFCEEIRR